LVLGKFLPYHLGHAHLIRAARAQVDELTVLVCSNEREPIPGGYRYQWVRQAHPDCRVVHVTETVPDMPGDDLAWVSLVPRYAGPVDVVFSSEDYGAELATRLGARHVCVDRERGAVPVSATMIREDPVRYWEFIPEHERWYFTRRVALVGAESVGKSTLAALIAREHDTVWVAEYGRLYCEGIDALSLGVADLEAIAWGQATWEDEAASRANRVLLCDTELHTTCTWTELTVGFVPAWMTAAARDRPYDLFLLLEADVPWVSDGVRVLGDARAGHTDMIRRELEAAGRRVLTVRGDFAARERIAREAVRALLAEPGLPAGR
jgi:NadR type nicotinamide-nucleotide adenylyltransferase